jgi:hypothetical protein
MEQMIFSAGWFMVAAPPGLHDGWIQTETMRFNFKIGSNPLTDTNIFENFETLRFSETADVMRSAETSPAGPWLQDRLVLKRGKPMQCCP